jgi:uncharacterized protein YjbI with pentapeptide repeats
VRRVTPGDLDYSGQTLADADFRGHVFEGRADFSGCVFTTRPDFSGAVFKGRVFFTGAVFEQGADFHEATFEGFADFNGVRITGEARLTGAAFPTGVMFGNALIDGALRLDRTDCGQVSLVGPLRATSVDLRLSVFHRRVRLEATSREIHCDRARFPGGVQFLVNGADIYLSDTELGPASLVSGYSDRAAVPLPAHGPPRLVTVSGTDMTNLTVWNVDLSACKFTRTHNLDKLRVDSDDAFGWTPRSFWISRRQITGDERRWRFEYAPARLRERWRPPADWPQRLPPNTAGEVIKSYRALRKAREEAKDEPGAADFYYGEMEMRRLGTLLLRREQWRRRSRRGWLAAQGEYTLLWLYWLVSGYGLRAWRAFATLAVMVALAAAAFLAWGFPAGTRMDYTSSLRFTLRAATSLLRGSDQALTPTGEWIELVLRFLGPLLLGLAVLALRGRVRR